MPSVLAPEGLLGGFDAQADHHKDLVPGLYFVLRLHEFSIPLGKQFGMILKPNLDS